MLIDGLDTSHVRLGDRPLIVCDVDDVVLQFIVPFERFLVSEGYRLVPRSFKLHGNIETADGAPADDVTVSRLIETFFERQEDWQAPLALAGESLAVLSATADIVLLTAMPPVYRDQRRRLLDRFELDYPLLASLQPKGPIVKALHGARDLPVVFIDDMVRNLHSVHEHVDRCLLLHLMPVSEIHRFAPSAMDGIAKVAGWEEAAAHIGEHLSLPPAPARG
ncbi:hypothetical protein [Rhizobium sp. 21-4511-3d]